MTLFDPPAPPLHVIVREADAHLARLVLLLGELYGHGPWLTATVEHR